MKKLFIILSALVFTFAAFSKDSDNRQSFDQSNIDQLATFPETKIIVYRGEKSAQLSSLEELFEDTSRYDQIDLIYFPFTFSLLEKLESKLSFNGKVCWLFELPSSPIYQLVMQTNSFHEKKKDLTAISKYSSPSFKRATIHWQHQCIELEPNLLTNYIELLIEQLGPPSSFQKEEIFEKIFNRAIRIDQKNFLPIKCASAIWEKRV